MQKKSMQEMNQQSELKDHKFTEVRDVSEIVEVEHYFSEGVYMKYGTIKANMLIMGYPHKTKHMNMLISGTITLDIDGVMKTFTAPCMIESNIGTSKMGYTHDEVVMCEIHPTTETDVDKLEDMLLDKNMTKEHLTMFNNFHKELRNDTTKWLGT